MRKLKDFTKYRYFNLVLALIISVLCCISVYKHFSIFYFINDDTAMRNIVSGAYLGKPDGHLIFIQYVLGWVLSMLYKIIPMVDWYGLMLFGTHFLCMFFFLERFLEIYKGKNKIVILGFGIVIFSLFDLDNIIVSFQFTTTAAVCAAMAIFLLVSFPRQASNKKWIWYGSEIVFLTLLSFCIREKVLYMLAPFGVIIWLYKIYTNRIYKRMIRRYLFLGLCMVIGIGVISFIETVAYSSEEWKEYKEFNKARSLILDYYGYPDYQDNRELYEELDINQEEFNILTNNALTFSSDLSKEKYIKIAEFAKKNYYNQSPLIGRINTAFRDMCHYSLYLWNHGRLTLILVLYIGICLYCIQIKNNRLMIMLGSLFFLREIMYFYLCFKGRFPERIYDSLLMGELFMLTGLIIFVDIFARMKIEKNKVLTAVLTIVLVIFGISGYVKFDDIKRENTENSENNSMLLTSYCGQHLKNRYILDASGYTVGYDPFLIRRNNSYMNFLTIYGWMCNSELYIEKKRKMDIEEIDLALLEDNVYFIETGSTMGKDTLGFLSDYYQKKGINLKYEVVDSIIVTEGEYRILNFRLIE